MPEVFIREDFCRRPDLVRIVGTLRSGPRASLAIYEFFISFAIAFAFGLLIERLFSRALGDALQLLLLQEIVDVCLGLDGCGVLHPETCWLLRLIFDLSVRLLLL